MPETGKTKENPPDKKIKRNLLPVALAIGLYAIIEFVYLRHILAISVNGAGDSPELLFLYRLLATVPPHNNIHVLETIGKTLTGVGVSVELFALGVLGRLAPSRKNSSAIGGVIVIGLVFLGLTYVYDKVRQNLTISEEARAVHLVSARMRVPLDAVTAMNVLARPDIDRREHAADIRVERTGIEHIRQEVAAANKIISYDLNTAASLRAMHRDDLAKISRAEASVSGTCRKAVVLRDTMHKQHFMMRVSLRYREGYGQVTEFIANYCRDPWNISLPEPPPFKVALPKTVSVDGNPYPSRELMYASHDRIYVDTRGTTRILRRIVEAESPHISKQGRQDAAMSVYLLPILVAVACMSLTLNVAMLVLTLFRYKGFLWPGIFVYGGILVFFVVHTATDFHKSSATTHGKASWVVDIAPYTEPTERIWGDGVAGTDENNIVKTLYIPLSVPRLSTSGEDTLRMKLRKRLDTYYATRKKIDTYYARIVPNTSPPRLAYQTHLH